MQPRKCPLCHKNMVIIQYINTEAELDFEYKGFRCDLCNSTYPYETLDSLEHTLPEDNPDAFIMKIGALEGYENWLQPKSCPFCETALLGIIVNSKDLPDISLFEGFECSSCKSYFDKTVLSKLKNYIGGDNECERKSETSEKVEEDGLNWEAAVAKYEQLAGLQKHSTES